LRNDPHRPRRISCRMPSDSGVAIDVDCDICPIFSSSVMRATSASTRWSISPAASTPACG
jgi:hypothetical protein